MTDDPKKAKVKHLKLPPISLVLTRLPKILYVTVNQVTTVQTPNTNTSASLVVPDDFNP
jgi:hypothetical protein